MNVKTLNEFLVQKLGIKPISKANLEKYCSTGEIDESEKANASSGIFISEKEIEEKVLDEAVLEFYRKKGCPAKKGLVGYFVKHKEDRVDLIVSVTRYGELMLILELEI